MKGQSLHTLSGPEGIVLDFMLKYLSLTGGTTAAPDDVISTSYMVLKTNQTDFLPLCSVLLGSKGPFVRVKG